MLDPYSDARFPLYLQGGSVCVPQEEERLADLAGCINRLKINWLYLTSSVALILKPGDVPGLETLVVGGEAVHKQVVETWAESGVRLINAYGYVVNCRHPSPRDRLPLSRIHFG